MTNDREKEAQQSGERGETLEKLIAEIDGLTTDQQKSWPDRFGTLVKLGALRAIRQGLVALQADALLAAPGETPPSCINCRRVFTPKEAHCFFGERGNDVGPFCELCYARIKLHEHGIATRGETPTTQEAETPERTLRSIAAMLGWMNVPPRHVLEAEIRGLKALARSPLNPPSEPGAGDVTTPVRASEPHTASDPIGSPRSPQPDGAALTSEANSQLHAIQRRLQQFGNRMDSRVALDLADQLAAALSDICVCDCPAQPASAAGAVFDKAADTLKSETGGEYSRADHEFLDAFVLGRELAGRVVFLEQKIATRERHIQQLVDERQLVNAGATLVETGAPESAQQSSSSSSPSFTKERA